MYCDKSNILKLRIMKTIAIIKIETNMSTDIKEAFTEAIRLANLLGVIIEFEFNGVLCSANKFGNADIGAKNYREAFRNKSYTAFSY